MAFGRSIVLLNLVTLHQVVENGKRHIRTDGAGTIAQQQGGMHHLTNFATLYNQGSLHTLTHAYQIVVDSRDGQQRGDGSVHVVDVAVAEDNVVHTLVHAGLGLMTQIVQCLAQAFLALLHIKENGQFLGIESFIANVTQYVQLCVGQYGLWQAHHLTVRGIRRQDVGTYSADILCEAHHQLLTDGVDGGVGNLRKLLTEVVEQHLRTVGDDCQRRVVTHGSHRLLPSCSHRDDGLVDILLTKAKGDQFLLVVLHAVIYVPATLQLLQLHAVLVEPLAIRMCLGQLLLDFAIIVYPALLRVNQQNLTRLQATLANYVTWLKVHHAHLTGHHHHAALGDGIAAGAQTVSVEHTTRIATIAEQQGSRTVPRLHQDRVVLVEGLQVLTDGVLVVEALRYQNGHSLRQ